MYPKSIWNSIPFKLKVLTISVNGKFIFPIAPANIFKCLLFPPSHMPYKTIKKSFRLYYKNMSKFNYFSILLPSGLTIISHLDNCIIF